VYETLIRRRSNRIKGETGPALFTGRQPDIPLLPLLPLQHPLVFLGGHARHRLSGLTLLHHPLMLRSAHPGHGGRRRAGRRSRGGGRASGLGRAGRKACRSDNHQGCSAELHGFGLLARQVKSVTKSQPADEASRDEMDGLQPPRDKLLQAARWTAAEGQAARGSLRFILAAHHGLPIYMKVKIAEWHEASGGQGG
jgi:hypothetical protein